MSRHQNVIQGFHKFCSLRNIPENSQPTLIQETHQFILAWNPFHSRSFTLHKSLQKHSEFGNSTWLATAVCSIYSDGVRPHLKCQLNRKLQIICSTITAGHIMFESASLSPHFCYDQQLTINVAFAFRWIFLLRIPYNWGCSIALLIMKNTKTHQTIAAFARRHFKTHVYAQTQTYRHVRLLYIWLVVV